EAQGRKARSNFGEVSPGGRGEGGRFGSSRFHPPPNPSRGVKSREAQRGSSYVGDAVGCPLGAQGAWRCAVGASSSSGAQAASPGSSRRSAKGLPRIPLYGSHSRQRDYFSQSRGRG